MQVREHLVEGRRDGPPYKERLGIRSKSVELSHALAVARLPIVTTELDVISISPARVSQAPSA
jgi:hypothetical protein